MLHYSLGYLYSMMGHEDKVKHHFDIGAKENADYCFPNTMWDYIVLNKVVVVQPQDAKAHYYIGNWLYDKKRTDDAISFWEASVQLDPGFRLYTEILPWPRMRRSSWHQKG